MSHSIEVVSPVSRKISVTIPAEEVNSALSTAAKAVGAGVTLPGFRKGKAPAAVIEKRLTAEVYARASETLVNQKVADILEQEHLKPLSKMDFDGDPIARGKDLVFSFTFETLPEIALPEDLSALSVTMGSSEATPEEIEEFSTGMRKRVATLEDVAESRLPQNGDIVTIDVDGEVDGKPVQGMKVREYSIQLTEPQEGKQLSELDKIIRGLRPGEEGDGSMPCPEDHPDESLRGKTANLHVKLHKIQKEILPELDDDFAKKVGFQDVEALKKALAEQAGRRKAANVRAEAEQSLLDSCLEGLEFPLPESVVKAQQADYENELRGYLQQQGLEKDAIEESLKTMQEETRRQGEERARAFVFLAALAQREKLEVSSQEIDLQIMQMASQYKEDFRKLREALYSNGAVADIRDRMLNRKAMDLMFDKAQKTEPAAAAE
ncbi:MAG: trigger factor [Mailhella sp.]|nr:trigger factor [Mailhella sp.]